MEYRCWENNWQSGSIYKYQPDRFKRRAMKKQFKYRKIFLSAFFFINVLSSAAQQQYIHTATKTNNAGNGDATWLDKPELNNNPLAIIFVTPELVDGINLNPHPFGVFYFQKKWNIFNLDQRVIPENARFNVLYFTRPDSDHFLYTIKQEDIQRDGAALIDHPALNGNPDAQVLFLNSWGYEAGVPVSNRDEVNFQYNAAAGKWAIVNINKKSLFAQVAYNIAISNQGNTFGVSVKSNPDISIKDPVRIIIPETDKPVDKKTPVGIIIPETDKPVDKNLIVTKTPIPPSYDFSNVHICIEEITNKSLPPKTPVTQVPLIPKIKYNGDIELVSTVIQPLSIATELMWSPGENITVGFLPGETITVINKVKQYLKEWETYANIRFVFSNDVSQAKIKVGFKKDGTSWSWMGRDVLVNQSEGRTMNLGWLDDNTSESEFRRVVLHEFGHALGFIHEHQASTANIPWDSAKVYSYFAGKPNYWNRVKVDNNIFKKYSVTSTNSSTYDKFSIMHYSYPAYLTKDSSTFPENTNLSVIDKAFVSKVYPYPPGPATSKGVLLTGDDCDEIEFTVEYNVVSSNVITIILEPGRDLNNNIISWWKKIAIPLKGGSEIGMEIQDGFSASKTLPVVTIDEARGIAFGKAKMLGVHTGLTYTWKIWPAIRGGCRIKLVWRRDRCG